MERTAAEVANSGRIALAECRSVAWSCVLRRHAHLEPDAVAIRFGARSTTFAQLDARIDRGVAALVGCGVRGGDRVAILSGNRPEFLEALGAINRLGAIAVPINFRLVGAEVAYHLTDSSSTVLFVDPEREAVALDAVARSGASGLAVAILVFAAALEPDSNFPDSDTARPEANTAGADPAKSDISHSAATLASFEAALAAADPTSWTPDAATLEGWRAESAAVLMYTSGTTGRPKGAVLTHLNLLCQTLTQVRAAHLVSSSDVTLVTAPLFHIAGLAACTPTMLLGNRLVIMPSGAFDPGALLDVMESEGVTHMFLVPTMWQALCEVNDTRERSLTLRSMSWGASPALPSTLRAMSETFPGVPNIAVFGQTEMSPVTCALEGDDAIRKLGSVGKPVATVDMRVVDDEMVDVAPGGVGEIVYRGPNLMTEYWNRPDATAEAMSGGWFHSGDLVRVDDEGFVTVVDRKKDMIISGGENIYSTEIEAVIDSHPKVRDVAVVAAPHPKWVETPVAIVTPADPSDPPTEAEIIEWVRTHLAPYKKPTVVEVIQELPRNASGKVLKTVLRAKYWSS